MRIKERLTQILEKALQDADIDIPNVIISDATRASFGDYQFNGIMKVAKKLGENPRKIASTVVNRIERKGMIDRVEVAGAGFINIWLNSDWLSIHAKAILEDERVGVKPIDNPKRVVVDYSGPNMAKEMHVGHLRSTIIGDSLASLFEFLGDEVIRQNHIGDWGTQFGMLIAYLEEEENNTTQSLKDLEQFYKNAKKRFDDDEDFARRAREYVVKLQSGDQHCLTLWQRFIDISLGHCEEVYEKLNVKLKREDVRAESFYNEQLPTVINLLREKGISVNSDGAECVFVDGENKPPLIVKKRDGGYLYATTDLSALMFRVNVLKVKRICYVVDARQKQHFRQIFKISRDVGFVGDDVKLEHIAFGMMLDKNGKPFKTRDGGTVKLIDLLNEAISRAKETIKKREKYDEKEIETIASAIGIGAIKYADLSVNRESNYIFSWDKMLSFDGNTALYIQYAYARIQSIFRKYNGEMEGDILITNNLERRLILTILKFEDILIKAYIDATPHTITQYLYELVVLFMKFYETNPILRGDVEKEIRISRLLMTKLTKNLIKKGLELLGIDVVERI